MDDPEVNHGTSEDNEESMPVPQVKVAPDGSIIIDEASVEIETTAAKKAKEDLLKSPLVFESANQATNYGSWGMFPVHFSVPIMIIELSLIDVIF